MEEEEELEVVPLTVGKEGGEWEEELLFEEKEEGERVEEPPSEEEEEELEVVPPTVGNEGEDWELELPF